MKYSFLILLLVANNSFAENSDPGMLSNYVYIFELFVIAIVAIALIILTFSIARSRRRISDMVTEIRGEMNEERTVFAMTVKSIKEKEKQVSYMAHLLQTHLESGGSAEGDSSKKKAISDEMVVEILDEVIHQNEQQENGHVSNISNISKSSSSNVSKPSSVTSHRAVDPRMIAADGSVKQAHFGPDQYLTDISHYQQQACLRVQHYVKQADQHVSNVLNDIRGEMDLVEAERANLKDYIFAINSSIRDKDPQKMNSKDRKIVQKLSYIDGRLQTLEASQQEINKCYTEAMTQIKKCADALSNETVEEVVTTTA